MSDTGPDENEDIRQYLADAVAPRLSEAFDAYLIVGITPDGATRRLYFAGKDQPSVDQLSPVLASAIHWCESPPCNTSQHSSGEPR